jgi:tetratricopeptide (TPR) repeat protein
VQIRCACGKALRVPDHLRGKKVRCPGCGSSLQVAPASPEEPERPKAATPRPGFPWFYLSLAGSAIALLTCCGVSAVALWFLNRPMTFVQTNSQVATKPAWPEVAPVKNAELSRKDTASSPKPGSAVPPAGEKDSFGLLFLDAPEIPAKPVPHTASGILARELFRQALLLTASDYLGLTVRDGALGDLPPSGLPDDHRVGINVTYQQSMGLEMKAHVRGASTPEPLWQQRFPSNVWPVDVVSVGANCEIQSRTKLLSQLRNAGFQGKSNPTNNDVQVPRETDDLLALMTCTAQFQALRQLHALMKVQGESPWVLAGLARGYANLGVLTEFHWSSDHKSFKARAMLYAQRLVVRQPQSSWALWQRAYVLALVGVHEAALSDLSQASKLEKTPKKKGDVTSLAKRPLWVDAIEAYCNFDTARVQETAKVPGLKQLGHLLAFLAVEDTRSPHLALAAGRTLLAYNPECYRVHDSMSSLGGVAAQHRTTVDGINIFSDTYTRRLASIPGLPKSAAKLASSGVDDAQVSKALILFSQSGLDDNPLSWAVLGRLGQETRFAQISRRLDFMLYRWSVPTKDFLQEAMPLVADHPYLPFLKTFGVDRAREQETFVKLIRSLPPPFYETGQAVRLRVLQDLPANAHTTLDDIWTASSDNIYRDFWLMVDFLAEKDQATYAQRALAFSPHAPFAKAILIKTNWQVAEPKAADWEKDCQHPRILFELGQRYLQLKRHDDAERCLQRCVALSPDYTAYKTLASAYKAQGKMDLWQQTLEEYLKAEDTGLGHAQAQVEIALEFMKQKQWAKALPYAEEAAQTFAEWALLCASECNEALKNWDKAELHIRAASERYGGSYFKWYYWCQRTGKGDVGAASKFFAKVIIAIGPRATDTDRMRFSGFYTMSGQKQKLVDLFKAWFAQSAKSNLVALNLTIACDEAGDVKARDQALKDFPATTIDWYKQLAELFQTCLANGEQSPLDLAAVDATIKPLAPKFQSEANCLVGRFLACRGQTKDSLEYFKRCATAPDHLTLEAFHIAIVRLRAAGKAR